MRKLLWAECRKLRRSHMVWITIFATGMIAAIVFAGGLDVYSGPEVHYGLKSVQDGMRYLDNAGWYMDEAQPWATYFVLPAVIALLGSYMICREEEEDTLKSLRLIPVDEGKLTAAKMLIAFVFSVFLYLLLFAITFLTEAALHGAALSAKLILTTLREYFLDGVGVFLAVSPIIALSARIKKYWLALIFAEVYSMAGLFAGMVSAIKSIYPIGAVFNLSGYNITTPGKRAVSAAVLLLCGCLSVLLLKRTGARQEEM